MGDAPVDVGSVAGMGGYPWYLCVVASCGYVQAVGSREGFCAERVDKYKDVFWVGV
jgi:hypothetical protein